MSRRADYTPEEWRLLGDLPMTVIQGAIMADGEGGSKAKDEMLAGARQFARGVEQLSENTLIQDLAATAQSGETDQGGPRPDETRQTTAEQDVAAALEMGREASALLAQKSTEAEATEYKRWILDMADRVVNAEKSGTFLGLGGERLSGSEDAFLFALATALGIPRSR